MKIIAYDDLHLPIIVEVTKLSAGRRGRPPYNENDLLINARCVDSTIEYCIVCEERLEDGAHKGLTKTRLP